MIISCYIYVYCSIYYAAKICQRDMAGASTKGTTKFFIIDDYLSHIFGESFKAVKCCICNVTLPQQ